MEKDFRNKIDSYPLQWPLGWKRATHRKASRFQVDSFARSRDEAFHELKLMGVGNWNVILSTNIPLRKDGLPYSGMAQPNDPGVAIYFTYKDKSMVLACDSFKKVEDNLRAIAKTIEAMRGITRWGASEMMEKAFTGFEALPAPKSEMWWDILKVDKTASYEEVKLAWKTLARKYHPDISSMDTSEQMKKINAAYAEAEKELHK